MKKIFTFSLCLLLLASLLVTMGACKKKAKIETDPNQLGTDKEIYEKAKKRIKRDPEKARLLFKEIMHLYPDSLYARRAKIGIADSYFKQKDAASLIMAATEYQEYVNMYPNSPDSVYSKFQIAMCYFNQMKSPGRDQTNTHLAVQALGNMIKQFPDTTEADDAKKKLLKARNNLATHYFRIGVSNFRLKALKGALTRFKQVIDDYPDFQYPDKLFYFTGMTYFYMRDYTSSISFFQKIVNSYPKSKYIKKTTKMITRIAGLQSVQGGEKKPEKKQ